MTSARSNYLVIGLSGVTCGGKTTLSARLVAHFPPGAVQILNLDNYFITDTDRLNFIPSLKHHDYDAMNSLDWERYCRDVRAVIARFAENSSLSARDQVLLLDGFLLFNEPHLLSLCHLKYDFTLPYAVAKQRREARVYDPPDVPGYFEQVAWPAFLKHSEEIAVLKRTVDIVTVDGTEEMDKIVKRVLEDIETSLQE